MNLQTVKFDSRPVSFVLLDANEVGQVEPVAVEDVAPKKQTSSVEILEKIASKIDQLNNRSDDEIIQMAISLARTIVERLIGDTPDLLEQRLVNIVNETLASQDQAVGVHINAENYETVTSQFGEKIQAQGVKLVVDNSVAPGECIVRFEDYDLVSKIDRQLDDIESCLEELAVE